MQKLDDYDNASCIDGVAVLDGYVLTEDGWGCCRTALRLTR
jgi:hypothetical protein